MGTASTPRSECTVQSTPWSCAANRASASPSASLIARAPWPWPGRYSRAVNPAVWVERHGRLRPDDPALAGGGRVHATWRTFAARTAGAAAGLRDDLGLSPGDRVAIVMRNR